MTRSWRSPRISATTTWRSGGRRRGGAAGEAEHASAARLTRASEPSPKPPAPFIRLLSESADHGTVSSPYGSAGVTHGTRLSVRGRGAGGT